MKTKFTPLLFLVAGCLGFFLARVYAQAPAKSAATDSSTVVFENEKVRCILYQTGTGKNVCGFGMHSHPAHLYIMKTAGKFRVTTPDGKEATEEAKAGEVGWEPAVTHRYEAISPGTVEVYLVEVKDKDWKPSTGLNP
jgi:hypothetical protein